MNGDDDIVYITLMLHPDDRAAVSAALQRRNESRSRNEPDDDTDNEIVLNGCIRTLSMRARGSA